MHTERKVVMVAVQATRKVFWVEPRLLHGREPAIFDLVQIDHRFFRAGPHCLISFRKPNEMRANRKRVPDHQAAVID